MTHVVALDLDCRSVWKTCSVRKFICSTVIVLVFWHLFLLPFTTCGSELQFLAPYFLFIWMDLLCSWWTTIGIGILGLDECPFSFSLNPRKDCTDSRTLSFSSPLGSLGEWRFTFRFIGVTLHFLIFYISCPESKFQNLCKYQQNWRRQYLYSVTFKVRTLVGSGSSCDFELVLI